jgi:short-subunit dehydrogenase
VTNQPLRLLITGSNRGIGRETARYFAERGARVAINGRDADRLESVRQEFASAGHDVVAIPGDISDPEQISVIVDGAVRELGGLDVLVNNAAVSMRGRFEDLVGSVVDTVIGTNVTGTIMTTVRALPHLRKSKGSVIFISSLAGLWGMPLISVYAASKMALTAIVESLRTELSGSGVHVGIAHVGITQHDGDKAILGVDGTPFPLAPRPGADTQEKVARAVYRMVHRRRNRAVLTPGGHALEFFSRYFPRIFAVMVRGATARINRIAK